MTLAELEYGVLRHPKPEIARARLDTLLLEPIEILVFDSAAATVYAELRHAIRAHPIGAHDLIIASIAVARGIVLVTRNLREFERVPDLAVEDWTKPE
jgi:tRNA(fMet)-specific endonuclease VapC